MYPPSLLLIRMTESLVPLPPAGATYTDLSGPVIACSHFRQSASYSGNIKIGIEAKGYG